MVRRRRGDILLESEFSDAAEDVVEHIYHSTTVEEKIVLRVSPAAQISYIFLPYERNYKSVSNTEKHADIYSAKIRDDDIQYQAQPCQRNTPQIMLRRCRYPV